MTVTLFLAYIFIKPAIACNAGTAWEESIIDKTYDDGNNGAVDPFFLGPLNDTKKWYADWPDSDGIINGVKYYDWMRDYLKKLRKEDIDYIFQNGGKRNKYPADAGLDWPSHWQGLGPGEGGVAPPPYAIAEESSGKPGLCYLPPKLGTCKSYTIRWGFNPYKNECAEFIYSGCDGNMNNFYTKKRCVAVCHNVPETTCVHNPDEKTRLTNFEKWISHLPHGEF